MWFLALTIRWQFCLSCDSHMGGVMVRLFLILALLIPQVGKAEPRCPDTFSPSNTKRTVTSDLYPIPLDKKITVLYEGDYYQIPAGYFTGWSVLKTNKRHPSDHIPKGINPDEVQQYSSLNFNFWMPSLRYPERQLIETSSLRPCEDGRSYVSEDSKEYLVAVFTQGSDELKPSQKFQNSIDGISGGMEGQLFTKKHGLLEYYSKNLPPKDTKASKRYTNIKGTLPEVMIRCTPLVVTELTPICTGFYYYPKKNIHLMINFETQDLPHWRKNVDAAFQLLERWKVTDNKTLEHIKTMKVAED